MKHSCQINGYDTLNLTKLDILDDIEEIKVAVKYLVDGKELPGFPGKLLDFPLLWLCFELIWLGCSESGNAEDDRGVIRCLAWVEDVDWCCVIIRRTARELQKVYKFHRRVSRNTDRVDRSGTRTREYD